MDGQQVASDLQRSNQNRHCYFFLRGACRYGDRCKYIHSASKRNEQQNNRDISVLTEASAGSTSAGEPVSRPSGATAATFQFSASQSRDEARLSSSTNRTEPCRAWASGSCPRGNQCTFSHRLVESISSGIALNGSTNQSSPSSAVPPARKKRGEIPCKAWKAGSCPKGDKCWFGHDPEVQAHALRLRQEQEARSAEHARKLEDAEHRRKNREAEQARRDAARKAEQERREAAWKAEQKRREAEKAQRDAERARKEADLEQRRTDETRETLRELVSGTTLVTFGAGLQICALVTGFDAQKVIVRNLPADATKDDVCLLMQQAECASEDFFVESVRKVAKNEGRQEALVVFQDARKGRETAELLDKQPFRGEVPSVRTWNAAVDAAPSSCRDSNVLTITCRLPSRSVVASYPSMEEAQNYAQQLNGTVYQNRRIRAEMNACPPNLPACYFNPRAVKVMGMDPGITVEELCQLVGSSSTKDLKSQRYDIGTAHQELATMLERLYPEKSGLMGLGLEIATSGGVHEKIIFRARFRDRTGAAEAYTLLLDKPMACIGNAMPQVFLPPLHSYQYIVPVLQYKAQRALWEELSSTPRDEKACCLQIQVKDTITILRVQGNELKLVGALKVRVENALTGARLLGWHASFGTREGDEFMGSIARATGAHVRVDRRAKTVRAYGSATSIRGAQEKLDAKLERLGEQWRTVPLRRQSVRFFVQGGLATLHERFGTDAAQLDGASAPATIRVRNNDDMRQALDALIHASLSELSHAGASETTCPVCFCEVTAPRTLACGHAYCHACLKRLVESAPDTKEFPLVCVGADGACRAPVPLAVVRRLLTAPEMNALLAAALAAHVERHPDRYQHCRTVDCGQIYRPQGSDDAPVCLECPGCFREICASCHEDGHAGMTCSARKSGDKEFEEWQRTASDVKRCPRCNCVIERIDGCNHVHCKCDAHICWRCMKWFSTGKEAYDHMEQQHGGPFDLVARVHV